MRLFEAKAFISFENEISNQIKSMLIKHSHYCFPVSLSLYLFQLTETNYILKCRKSCPLLANVTTKELTFTEFQL